MNENQSVIDNAVAISAEGSKRTSGNSPIGEYDGKQHTLEGIETFFIILRSELF